ncbi:M20 family metallopeptidase [Brevibacillus centrosporus]|uniref:M20 family metallopeptidase n=1 Tax=Brevibacillus centrosporus TaxID=54910 RepID=UPI000F09F485|nr:M20 family metallopeptidase [Brevibacillus centrosporus]MEC2128288.1 M20 family metallopeptidase [Brevibacillus centrosporus]MED4909711.1 M20 family metallopeptidase [Brevibacillus centrosporus]RNB73859.1 M20 family peptidase [Brevibacillus centrosporus]GED30750.1 peptidase M20 [Brevibacillus centrosporus]
MTSKWTDHFQQQLPEILEELRTYVEIETPTHNKQAVDQLGHLIADRFRALGCKIDTLYQPTYGDQLRIEYGDGPEQIMVLGHFDTVKELGTLVQEPWKIEDGRVYGPGTYDMKAGIIFSYFALKTIIEQQIPLQSKLVFFWNTDEEIGSVSSEKWIREEAKRSKFALVIEPAAGDGSLKTSRKGGGDFILKVKGRAAHAGNDHALGVNAIEELAHHVIAIQGFTDYDAGTTLSVGTIRGGTVSNVVPDYAEADIDVRISASSEADRITTLMHQLKPVLPGAQLIVEGGITKPPMERTAATEQLFLHAQEQALLEGFTLTERGVGGTSDGNFTADEGTPTLDGLGPVGDGAHASHEHVVIEAIPGRIAVLLRLFTSL